MACLSDATGCAAGTLSGSATVTVLAHPTASVSGGGTVCSGSSVSIQAALSGSQPYTVTWSDGTVQNNVSSNSVTRIVSPTVTTNYTVTALSDSTACSAGTLSGSALVTVNAHPTASVSGGSTICSGSSVNIQASLSGSQPYTVTWSDGTVQNNVSSNSVTRVVSPAVTTNYTVTALSDSTGCSAGTLSGSAAVTVKAHPTASVTGGGTICSGNSVSIQVLLTGTQPYTVTWSDGPVQSNVSSNSVTRIVSPTITTNYTVTALADSTGCSAGTLSGSAAVTVKAHPTATVSGGGTICSGTSVSIQAALNGSQPYTVTWSDGLVQNNVSSNSVMRIVSPTLTTNYTVIALSDSTGCSAGTLSGSALVAVNPLPTARVSGGGTICSGTSVSIQASLTGTQPYTVTWSDGTVQNNVSSNSVTRIVSPTVTSNYTVTALSDATGCPAGTLSGSALVAVNPLPTASVSGGGTICSGSSASIQAALTGTQPWTVTWSDGFLQSGVTNSPATRSVSPPVTTNYTVTALSNATGCPAGTLDGSALVTVCASGSFRITSAQLLTPDQFVLTWDSISNNVYQVQSIDSLSAGSWITNATITASDISTSWTNTGISSVAERYYRVVNTP